MTNFEKYKDEITKIVYEEGKSIAREKNTGRLTCCGDINCVCCQFFYGNCVVNMFKWMFEEYQEPVPKLTKAEKGFCEVIKDGYIARDKNGDLYLYNNSPYVTETDWRAAGYDRCTRLCSEFFPFITWESNKAWSIEDLLKLEVEDND